MIEGSTDGKIWELLVDKSENKVDRVHDYIQLTEGKKARYLKITCVSVPAGKFSISGFRVFGKGQGDVPKAVVSADIKRDSADGRTVLIDWSSSEGAMGYVVYYGVAPDKLYSSVMVYEGTNLTLNGLNRDATYYFRVDAFNEAGVRRGGAEAN